MSFHDVPTNERSAVLRQGDIMLIPVEEIPDGLKKVPLMGGRMVLAEGEATGHVHAIEGEAQFLATDLEELEGRFLAVEQEAELVHDEHDTITVPPGNYEVRRQREYDGLEEQFVSD